jgi:protein TonB
VILEITIGKDGSVASARVLRSIPELDQAAIDAVLQWVYEPTLLNGEPIDVKSIVTINFTLR